MDTQGSTAPTGEAPTTCTWTDLAAPQWACLAPRDVRRLRQGGDATSSRETMNWSMR